MAVRRLLVTGGTGFIGRHICRAAVRGGYEVSSMSHQTFRWPEADGISHLVADIGDPGSVAGALAGRPFDVVVNCAGYIDHSDFFRRGEGIYQQHLLGVQNLVRALDRRSLQRLVQIGSSDEYGQIPGPLREEAPAPVPISPYGAAKLAATQFLRMLIEFEGFPAVVVRPFIVYGPGQSPPRFIPELIERLARGDSVPMTSGSQRRDFCYIDDFADGVLRLLAAADLKGHTVINLASGEPRTVRDVAEQVQTMIGRGRLALGAIAPANDNPDLWADITIAKTVLGWTPRTPLDQGLKRTIAAVRDRQPPAPQQSEPGSNGIRIRVSRSNVGRAEQAAVAGVIARGYLGMGEEVRRFEERLSEFFGRPALCCANGTAALQLSLQGAGIGAGDEVLVPSLTYVASYQAISALGAIPVSCDVLPHTLTLDWRDAQSRLSARTRAVMPVHYAGGTGELGEVCEFARSNGLRVIEDAAHALGTTVKGKRVGSFGDIACFSFDGIKTVTSGEGGCVVTDDAEVLRIVRDIRLLGVENDSEMRFAGGRSWAFDVKRQGWRYHMSNVMAAIGLEQLRAFGANAALRREHARRYDSLLHGHPSIRPLAHDYGEVVPHIYPVRIAGLQDRDAVRARLLASGIETGVHYFPNHHLSLYRDAGAAPLPVTDAVYRELLTLPLHPALAADDIAFVVRALTACLADD